MWPALNRPLTPARVPLHHRFEPSRPVEVARPGGLHAGEPENCRRDLGAFLAVWAHLALLLLVFKAYRVEGRGFQLLVAIATTALPIHYLLPYRWKQPCLLAVSLAGMAIVLGLDLAAIVLPVAAVLIGMCYLPWRWSVRAGLIALLAAGLAAGRAGLVDLGVPSAVWPVLGTLFMFRMIVLLYELKHAERPERPIDVLSYFFLLPNYCFLHFPVIDYRTFRRGYFGTEIHATMRRGLTMMTRGTVHLLLYRLVYHRLLIAPAEVHSPASLAGYLVCNYLLYLRVSGQFHMACGMLHLFGYQLPDTHHHYLLATGFTDYWRRINIYWKDFMVRLVFNPVVFRLKRRPQWLSLGVATIAVFLTTWVLHAYQSFWLRGHWGFSVPDALFWGVLGVLVMINVQQDARRPPRQRARAQAATPRDRAIRAAKVLGTLTTLTVLWSLWSSPSLAAWFQLFGRAAGR